MNNQIENIGRFEIWGVWAPELKTAIVPLLQKYEPFLPPWCQIAHVSFGEDMAPANADCGVDFLYRRLRFRFSERFFSGTPAEREEQFLHEFIHGYNHHLYNVAYGIVEDALKGEANELARTLAHKALNEANEGVTCDLTALVARLITGSLQP